jgi:hypothetical protein
MGIDACIRIYLRDPLDDARLEALRKSFNFCLATPPDREKSPALSLVEPGRLISEEAAAERPYVYDVQAWGLRFFSTYYPRGAWHRLVLILTWLFVNFPDGEVHYYGDCSHDDGRHQFTPADMAALTTWWATQGVDNPY